MEVPETHNFVAEGVVLHNSHGGSAFCYMGVANKDAFRIKKPYQAQFAETSFDPFNYETYETEFSPFD